MTKKIKDLIVFCWNRFYGSLKGEKVPVNLMFLATWWLMSVILAFLLGGRPY